MLKYPEICYDTTKQLVDGSHIVTCLDICCDSICYITEEIQHEVIRQ